MVRAMDGVRRSSLARIATVLVAVSGLCSVGCESSNYDHPGDREAGPGVSGDADVDAEADCYPVHNSGCIYGQRCTFVVTAEEPLTGHLDCVEMGTVQLGKPCTRDPVTGIDDCVSRAWCDQGICREICDLAWNSCDAPLFCESRGGQLADAGFGVCMPPCDLWAQDCPEGEACYLLLYEPGYPTDCAEMHPEPTGDQGCETVQKLEPQGHGECCTYINTCKPLHGCIQPDPVNGGTVCAAYCDPTGTVDPPPPTCADQGVDGPDDFCMPLVSFFSTMPDLDPTIGFCMDADVWGPASCHNRVLDPHEDGIDCCTNSGDPECVCTLPCG